VAPAVDISVAKAAVWLTLTAFLALIVLYFVGMDQGATSVFGNNTYVHAFVFARIFVEPVIDRAIGFEDGVGAAHEAMHGGGHEHGGEVFTRGVQANIGMGFGVLAFSVAMGVLFSVVFAVTYGRVGSVSARLLSLYIAGGMLLSLYVVPALKYPANPPAVSLDET